MIERCTEMRRRRKTGRNDEGMIDRGERVRRRKKSRDEKRREMK